MRNELSTVPLTEIFNKRTYALDFFTGYGLTVTDPRQSFYEFLETIPDYDCEEKGIDKANFYLQFVSFLEKMDDLSRTNGNSISSLTIKKGKNKTGEIEKFDLTLKAGEIYCIVGPTGSGKSRLLADIECLAQRDTPTDRQVFLDGRVPTFEERFSAANKLVAQLSQNMNFVMDLPVREFITMHAESRMIRNMDETVSAILQCANDLAGEQFMPETPLTQLSGGQSRALMIADTALLSISPVILIDEIENAGVDRKKALELLVKKEKIVLMSTHDPILALLGHKRIVIKNGGIDKIFETSAEEKRNLVPLQEIDARLGEIRNRLRNGERLDNGFDIFLNRKGENQ